MHTTVNGEQIHGECAPALGAMIDERNYFECALMEPLPLTDDGVYSFVTKASRRSTTTRTLTRSRARRTR